MLVNAGELRERAERLRGRLASCDLCPRRCGVDRLSGHVGYCGVGGNALVAAVVAHLGEEPPISGTQGAGTIFFGGCNLRCTYCQNRQISRQGGQMREMTAAELAASFLKLQREGCHNIELVTPSHLTPQILAALCLAGEQGLDLPVVYNTGGYDSVEVLRDLAGVVDVYLPDLKYASGETAEELSEAPDYWEVARGAIVEMHRQVGSLKLDQTGIARRGLIIRHLVLPNDLADSDTILEFIAGLEPPPPVSLMAQFYPVPECTHPLLQRPVFRGEYERVAQRLVQLGLDQGWVQDPAAQRYYRPDFSNRNPFST